MIEEDETSPEAIDDVGAFAMVPIWIFTVGLTPGELAIYTALRSYANRQDGFCFPTQKAIAERAGLSVVMARKAIGRFRDLSLIKTENIFRNDGSLAGLRYFIPLVDPRRGPPSSADMTPAPLVSGVMSPRIEQEEQIIQQTKQQTKNSPSRAVAPDQQTSPEAMKLCEELHAGLVSNGTLATVTASWRSSARLLLEKDKRCLDEALMLVAWCQTDSFWKGNIHSMSTFRRQYDKLRLRAATPSASGYTPKIPARDAYRATTGRTREVVL